MVRKGYPSDQLPLDVKGWEYAVERCNSMNSQTKRTILEPMELNISFFLYELIKRRQSEKLCEKPFKYKSCVFHCGSQVKARL